MKSIQQLFICGMLLFITSSAVQAIDVCGNGICLPPLENATTCPLDCSYIDGPPQHVETCDNGACLWPVIGTDADLDSIPDQLEMALAYKFFPNLWIRDHPEDKGVFYGASNGGFYNQATVPYRINFAPRSAGAWFNWACHDSPGATCLEYRLALPFRKDFGDTFILNYGGSVGDSEFISFILFTDIALGTALNDPSVWSIAFSQVNPAGSQNEGSTRYISCSKETGLCDGLNERIDVWAAEKTHATYDAYWYCNNNQYLLTDNCRDNDYNVRNDLLNSGKLQNVGELTGIIDSVILSPNSVYAPYDILDNTDFGQTRPYFDRFFGSLDWE